MEKTIEVTKRVSLVEKYRPRRIVNFIGQSRNKTVLSKFVSAPYPEAFLLVGGPGVGKTSMAQAALEEMDAEVWHLNSRQANWDRLTELCLTCESVPIFKTFSCASGKRPMHGVLIDEVDQITETAQYLLLSKLDSTQRVPNTVWFFTCNDVKKLEKRFVSRCIQLNFSEYGSKGEMQEELIQYLERVWREEGGNADGPNWAGVVRDKETNVRDCLNYLQMELLARG